MDMFKNWCQKYTLAPYEHTANTSQMNTNPSIKMLASVNWALDYNVRRAVAKVLCDFYQLF